MYDPFWLISTLNTAYGYTLKELPQQSSCLTLFFFNFRVSHRTKRSLMKSWLKFSPKLVPKRTQERYDGYILLCTISHLRPFLSVWRRLELVCVVAFYYVVRAMARVHLFLRHVKSCHRVRTGHEKPGKSWNFRIPFSRPGKSWSLVVGHEKLKLRMLDLSLKLWKRQVIRQCERHVFWFRPDSLFVYPECQRLFQRGFRFLSSLYSAYGRRCVGLRPTPKIPAAREKTCGTQGTICWTGSCKTIP